MCHRFSNNCCFNAFMCRANLHSFFINFILYRFLFWHDRFSILLCEKDNKVTWVQSHVALPLVINLLKSLFRDDFSSNFNLLNFVLWFSNSYAFEKRFFLNSVSVIVILFRSSLIFFFYFLFIEFSFSFQWRFLNDSTIFFELSKSNECLHFFLKLNCLRVSIVERSITLIKHFFKNMF